MTTIQTPTIWKRSALSTSAFQFVGGFSAFHVSVALLIGMVPMTLMRVHASIARMPARLTKLNLRLVAQSLRGRTQAVVDQDLDTRQDSSEEQVHEMKDRERAHVSLYGCFRNRKIVTLLALRGILAIEPAEDVADSRPFPSLKASQNRLERSVGFHGGYPSADSWGCSTAV
jgi:hypothetical protein